MRKKFRLKKEFRKLLILFLGMALATQLVGNSVVFAMNDASDVIATYEVGVEGNNVLATLTKDGTITLSGSGDTKDYTSDTMPFQDNISNIKDIVIEEGVTSIGNAMFYNCKDINGKLIIPSTIVEIGDYAFAGDSYDLAPKITKIENSFTQSNIVVETPVEKKAEESTTEKNSEEQTTPATEEPTADTTQQDATPEQEEQPVQETVKTVKTIAEQQIGQNVFVSGQNGGYSCAETNKSFIDAVKEAGYVRADRFVLVRMDSSITQEVPVINGQLVLPSKPDTLGVPAEDALTSYQFAGWTVEGSDNVLNPKDNYAISDGVEELNLTSQWQQTWKINPQVKTEAKEEASVYSVVDRNTGKVLEKVNGYDITVQWQINRKDKEDENSWENIENATSFTYERKAEAGDTKSYFRAKVSITKQSRLRSTPQTEIMTTDAVNGVSVSNAITVIYNAGAGASGKMDNETIKDNEPFKPAENAFVRSDGKIFIGWKVALTNVLATRQDGSSINDNDSVVDYETIFLNSSSTTGVTNSIILTAQWSNQNVIYLDGENGSDTNSGVTKDLPVKTFSKAYELLAVNGTMETNKIILVGNYTINSNDLVYLSGSSTNGKKTTITSESSTSSSPTLTLSGNLKLQLTENTKFENITINDMVPLKEDYGLYAAGYTLIMGNNITTTIGNLMIRGASCNSIIQDTNLIIMSGKYAFVDGGGVDYGINGNTNITIYAPALIDAIYGGSQTRTARYDIAPINGSTNINMYGGTVEQLLGGNRHGIVRGNGNDYSCKINVYGGTITDSITVGPHAGGTWATASKKVILNFAGGTANKVYGACYDGTGNRISCPGGVLLNITGGKINELYGGSFGQYGGASNNPAANGVEINISSAIIGKVYGGSALDNVAGPINITIKNATITGNVFGGGLGNNSRNVVTQGDVSIQILDGTKIGGKVYGGADTRGSIQGTTTIDIKNATIGSELNKSNVFGGGFGVNTSVGKKAIINISNSEIVGDVYGSGDSGTVASTSINIRDNSIIDNVFGGGNNVGVNNSEITIFGNPTIKSNIYGGSNSTGTTTESIINIEGTVNSNIYGGGNGANTTVTTATVNIESTANIIGNIFGGGELGTVDTSNVNLNGGTIAGNVFGGGNNVGVNTSNVNINELINMTEADTAIFGGSNAQGTTDISNVIISNQIGSNIYGGGLGANTTVNTSYVTLQAGADASGEIYGGGKEGKATDSNVVLESDSCATDVFGGGHLVGGKYTFISSLPGSFASNIYGGSNVKGTVSSAEVYMKGKATNVYGAGKGSGTITDIPFVHVSGGDVNIDNVYGGGEEGKSTSFTRVQVIQSTGSHIGNVFGAGKNAGVEGDTKITIDDKGGAEYVYGGSDTSGEVTGTANITIKGTTLADVFGGGKGKETIVNKTNVITTSTAQIGANSTANVYGGSDEGTITTDTEMEIDGSVSGSVYGAGKGANSNVMKNTHVVLFGAIVTGDVFGGGNLGGIAGDSHVDLLSGTVKGSAFGGSNQALVQGSSKVHMGYSAATSQKKPSSMNMVVQQSIYGGGNTTDNGKAFDASNPFVLGDSEVLIDQDEYGQFSIGKNILGDGNMCVTAGNKKIEIRNYMSSGVAKQLDSIQRATELKLISSSIELKGAKDSANLLPTADYSMSRIDKLILRAGSYGSSLKLQKEVNLVRSLESLNADGTSMDSSAVKGTFGNSIIIQQGKGFELRTNEDVSRPGYGTVKGYTLLMRYDTGNNDINDGVYVLGGYDANSSDYGFVFGEDVYEIKESGKTELVNSKGEIITPETDGKSWNNWRLGRRVDVRDITLTASDRPSQGKTEAVISTWAADGSIYRIDKKSLKIENENSSTEAFTLVNPDNLSIQKDIDNTFGLEISTGQNGWLEQKNVGYIKGNTNESGNEMVLQEKNDMIAVTDSKVQPLINVSLSNKTGISKKDTTPPLLVTFDVNTYTKQADGTEMKTGTLKVKVHIQRNNDAIYNDTTIEAGKNYKGAIQKYEYGTDYKVGLTISQSSSITMQFARKASDGTAVPTKHELNFSTSLPIGTKILMIDRSTNDTKYYHYEAKQDVSKIALNDFVANDSSSDRYSPITNGSSAENYIFIIDFAGAPDFTKENIDASLIAYNGNTLLSEKHIVFSVYGNQRIYKLNSMKNDDTTYTPYSIGSTISVDLATSVNVTELDGIDTTGRDKQMGARVRLYSKDNDAYINIPSTWEVISQGTHYSAGGNSFTIKLADGLTVTNSNIYIQMSSIGNLPIGEYRLEIDLIGGALSNYPEDDKALNKDAIKIGIELKDYSYSIKSTMADKNKQLFSNINADKTADINLEKTTSAGASTTGVYVQQTLYKKDDNSEEYTAVPLTELFDPKSLPSVSGNVQNKLAWDRNLLNYKYKSNISAGTYRLQFDVMQADAFNDLRESKDVVRASDTINIVVTDD